MDDDETLEVLRRSLADGAPDGDLPAAVLTAAEAAGGWARLDDELAVLVADSADEPVAAGVRGSAVDARQLTWVAGDLTVECELVPDGLVGQAVPAEDGLSVELVGPDGSVRPLELRPDGSFLVRPAPDGPVGIRCHRPGRPSTLTPWLLP
jgi:hypothetical protein